VQFWQFRFTRDNTSLVAVRSSGNEYAARGGNLEMTSLRLTADFFCNLGVRQTDWKTAVLLNLNAHKLSLPSASDFGIDAARLKALGDRPALRIRR
jgi:hypothetical protein